MIHPTAGQAEQQGGCREADPADGSWACEGRGASKLTLTSQAHRITAQEL